jgi:hypothetical protein
MPDADDSVIEQLAARRSRARREPPPRRPARGAPVPPEVTGDATAPAASERTARAPQQAPTRPASPPPTGSERSPAQRSSASSAGARKSRPSSTSKEAPGGQHPIQLQPDEPIANFAVRVRRSLDDLVAWRLAELRRQGVRTTKVELTEMLLWELAGSDLDDLKQRLAAFRRHAPR